jgi:hypothetical protein
LRDEHHELGVEADRLAGHLARRRIAYRRAGVVQVRLRLIQQVGLAGVLHLRFHHHGGKRRRGLVLTRENFLAHRAATGNERGDYHRNGRA